MKQDRAVRTRRALLDAAAREFDRSGYEGTSLARVSAAAGVSLGAVTFHFAAKSDLAVAVREEGWSVTRSAIAGVTAEPTTPLRTVVAITLELARLMEQEVSVRSAIRLSGELPDAEPWSAIWLPTIRELLSRADEAGQLRSGARPLDVATLVEHLAGGAESNLRHRRAAASEFESAVTRLRQAWQLSLMGVSADGAGG